MTEVKSRPALFRALGMNEPPQEVKADGHAYQLLQVFKHDSWAATAVYQTEGGSKIVCKFNRAEPIFIFPMRWLGRRLARRENWFYHKLIDVDGVCDPVDVTSIDDETMSNVSAHVFIDGAPFQEPKDANDEFFDRLRELIAALHERGVAYVDLHKRENIIIDLHGRPNLMDFQVSYALGDRWPANGALAKALMRSFQTLDDYSVNKHFVRCRPDLLSPEELEKMKEMPAIVRWHRKFAVPLRTLRRAFLVKIGIRSGKGMAESEANPEIAFRSKKTEE